MPLTKPLTTTYNRNMVSLPLRTQPESTANYLPDHVMEKSIRLMSMLRLIIGFPESFERITLPSGMSEMNAS